MPENISKEWNDLQSRVNEMMKTEQKVSKFECKELSKLKMKYSFKTCKLNILNRPSFVTVIPKFIFSQYTGRSKGIPNWHGIDLYA